MTKSEAITLAFKSPDRFPVLVWEENGELVTQVDGRIVRASNMFRLDSLLEGIAPIPRNLYFIDEANYE